MGTREYIADNDASSLATDEALKVLGEAKLAPARRLAPTIRINRRADVVHVISSRVGPRKTALETPRVRVMQGQQEGLRLTKYLRYK